MSMNSSNTTEQYNSREYIDHYRRIIMSMNSSNTTEQYNSREYIDHYRRSMNSSNTTEQLLRHWHYETYWAYGAQLSSCVDRERYLELVKAFSKKYFGDTILVCLSVCPS